MFAEYAVHVYAYPQKGKGAGSKSYHEYSIIILTSLKLTIISRDSSISLNMPSSLLVKLAPHSKGGERGRGEGMEREKKQQEVQGKGSGNPKPSHHYLSFSIA